jgi:hypothetical protein
MGIARIKASNSKGNSHDFSKSYIHPGNCHPDRSNPDHSVRISDRRNFGDRHFDLDPDWLDHWIGTGNRDVQKLSVIPKRDRVWPVRSRQL